MTDPGMCVGPLAARSPIMINHHNHNNNDMSVYVLREKLPAGTADDLSISINRDDEFTPDGNMRCGF